jgi:CzcA family heavy metal efflux pump
MFERLIAWSIQMRLLVVAAAALLLLAGGMVAVRMPVDVFPDLTAPSVTVLTEAHGLAPEEVETLVTFPIETALNGAAGVRRVRSSSAIGISVVWVEFEWGTDIYIARQIVNEKLALVRAQLPPDVPSPVLAPVSSIMGEIMFIGLSGDASPMALRDTAEWVLRRRLLAIAGISQVIPIGGDLKQYQVIASPSKMAAFKVTFEELEKALRTSNQNSSGGFYTASMQEVLIRGMGRIQRAEDIEKTTVAVREGHPIQVRQIAQVVVGAALKRGVGSVNGKPAVVLGIMKQPGANTLELTKKLDAALDDIGRVLPRGMVIHKAIFRQADFIQVAVDNVKAALRDGSILVAIILFVFLLNFRTTFITLTAIPLSLIVAALVLKALGQSINTMTLGGMTIAIGELVDDAIVDVENVFRRLKENAHRPEAERRNPLDVIFHASVEIRSSIVYATLIIALVFLPLFFLSGVEGRLLQPLGISYVTSIFASLVVALTVTPALCAYLMAHARFLQREGEGPLVALLKYFYALLLRLVLWMPRTVMLAAILMTVAAVMVIPKLGRTFLPEFNEGALTISAVTLPGTTLAESDVLGQAVEETLLSFPEVKATSRRTGRAELDEHAQGVNAAEIDVSLKMGERSKQEFFAELRKAFSMIPGMVVNIGQPISHRIDHLLSGTRSAIAIKIFGTDLGRLRALAAQVQGAVKSVRGVVDLSVDQQQEIPQLRVQFDRDQISRFGLTVGELAERIEGIFAGHVVSQIIEEGRTRDLLMRYEDKNKEDLDAIGNTLIDVPGSRVPLKLLARLVRDTGPNSIERENVQRKIVVSCNVSGRDLIGTVQAIQQVVGESVQFPDGYYVVYGGQFESEAEASRMILMLSAFSVAGIFILLFIAFGSGRLALLVMVNLPLSLIGGVAAVYFTTKIVSVASLVGFITLFGIASRNGIMMISHFQQLLAEGKSLRDAIFEGSMERLSPILMTALTAGLALIPLIMHADAPGNEIQAPMAVVILGGLTTSTALNLLVVPPLFWLFGQARSEVERIG